MARRWGFYAFDWERYREIAPALERASETGDFSVVDIEGLEETLAELPEDADSTVAAGALISDTCSIGEPVIMDAGLPDLIRRLRRHVAGEEAAEVLGSLLTAAPNVADWYAGDRAPLGVLTEAQTRHLAGELARVWPLWHPPALPGGLIGIVSRLAGSDSADARLGDLNALVGEAAEGGFGLVVLLEG